jgi:hypothetical protein
MAEHKVIKFPTKRFNLDGETIAKVYADCRRLRISGPLFVFDNGGRFPCSTGFISATHHRGGQHRTR